MHALHHGTILSYDKMRTFCCLCLEIMGGSLGSPVSSSRLVNDDCATRLCSYEDIFFRHEHPFGHNVLGWVYDTHAGILLSLSCKFCCILTISSIFFSNPKK